jgi:signal transduction histidine kinase
VLAVRVESIGPVKIESAGGTPWWATFVPLIGSIVSSVVALGGVIWSLKIARDNTETLTRASRQTSEQSIWQKANEAELADIQAKLDGFYMPFWLLSKANHLLALDVKSRQSSDYRLLVQLFDKRWRDEVLSQGDRKLVEMICNNAEELRTLIATKAGLVDGTVLEYLGRASVHFRILHSAYKNELGTDSSMFSKYVYPRQLDGVIQLEIDRLKARAQELLDNPAKCPPRPVALTIPKELALPAWV